MQIFYQILNHDVIHPTNQSAIPTRYEHQTVANNKQKENKESNALCSHSFISILPLWLPRSVKLYTLAKYTFNENARGFIGQFEKRIESQ